MEQIAQFRFEGYKIVKSLLEIKSTDISKDLSLNFDLSGIDNRSERTFKLTMTVVISDKAGNLKAEICAIGQYQFDEGNDERQLGNFFNMNAPAILFPYVRAHIATLSTLCGLKTPLILPTLNLSGLAELLAKQTEKV